MRMRGLVVLAGLIWVGLAAKAERPAVLTMQAHGVHLRVVALRDDVLRVRYWREGPEPEDSSWAVLPEARRSGPVMAVEVSVHGFATKALRVEADADLRLTVSDLQGHVLQKDVAPVALQGLGFELAQAMPREAHYFGLGDKVGPMDRRGQTFTLWNTDAYAWQESTDPLYKSIPFFVTYEAGRAMGTLLDNTWRTHFDFGRTRPDTVMMGAVDGPMEYYLVYGPTPKQVMAGYAWLTGPTPLPPLWSLGFQQSRFSYMSQARVEEIAHRLRADRIPADAVYLDIDYQDHYRPFTVNTVTFPDMPGLVKSLHDQKLHVVAITDLHIAKAAGQGYAPYDNGLAQDRFVHNADGSVYSGEVWPGPAVFPEFTQQATRAWWGTLYTEFARMGMDGFWNDMNEPAVFKTPTFTMPLDAVHRIEERGFRTRTATHAEIHNVMGMENARATEEGLLRLRANERPFVLTRAAFAGAQRYAATWTGDNSATWNHLKLTTSMLKNLGMSGYSLAGADVGGYAGSPSAELLTKWLEIAAFQPIDRDHAEKGTEDHEVWANGPQQEAVRRRFIEERYRLMPYMYTTFEENTRTGLPMVRPLFLEFPEALADGRPMDVDPPTANEFLFGPDLLVAPPPRLEQTAAYEVQFPSAGWYDYWTGVRVNAADVASVAAGVQPEAGGAAKVAAVTVTPKPEELPVYVRPGTMLPYAPLTQSTMETLSGPLTLRVYLPARMGDACGGAIYTDDGHTFDYRAGKLLRVRFTCELTRDGGAVVRIGAHEGSYPAWWSEVQVEVYGLAAGKKARVKGAKETVASERVGGALRYVVKDEGRGSEWRVE